MPAGNLRKLKMAILYGADAVYLGTPDMSLRTKSQFSLEEVIEGVEFCHQHGKRAYLTLNLFSHNKDIAKLDEYVATVRKIKPDGLIIADPGVFQYVKSRAPELELHISTQANICSWLSVQFWQDLGVERIILSRELSLAGIKVVVDCANGAAYKVAPAVLWELGAEVITIGNEPNGLNINHECGSTHPVALARKVHEVRADIGIALDGDADRVLIVDEKGSVVDGDQLMAVIAESWSRDKRLTGGGIVATVMSNLGLERFLEDRDMILERTKVGDRYVVERMRSGGFNVGGEQSGHIVLSDYATTGDGLVAALQILACVQRMDRPVSEICHRFDPVPQILKNVRVTSGKPLEDAHVKSAIDSATDTLGKSGRLVIRPSGTEPLIRVMAEGDDRILVEKVVDELVDTIAGVKAVA